MRELTEYEDYIECALDEADYLEAAKAWDKEEAGKYTIYTVEQEDEGRL